MHKSQPVLNARQLRVDIPLSYYQILGILFTGKKRFGTVTGLCIKIDSMTQKPTLVTQRTHKYALPIQLQKKQGK